VKRATLVSYCWIEVALGCQVLRSQGRVYRDSPKEGTKGGKNERKALNLHNPRTCTDYTGITKKGDGREELRGEKCWRWQKRSGTADAR
jgi:hypothetical protein